MTLNYIVTAGKVGPRPSGQSGNVAGVFNIKLMFLP